MKHISHDRREGWLRNVQAGHAIDDDCVTSLVAKEVVEVDKTEDGSEDERCWDNTEVVVVVGNVRGTPHKLQMRAAAGLRPGGLR